MQTVAVVGLGYVGLPLAVEFGKAGPTIGYDRSSARIEELARRHDRTAELSAGEIAAAHQLRISGDPALLQEADFIVVAVPTPVDAARQPDFGPLVSASEIVGRHMKRGTIVIYESTVYPGATEEVCVPILEQHSGCGRSGLQSRLKRRREKFRPSIFAFRTISSMSENCCAR